MRMLIIVTRVTVTLFSFSLSREKASDMAKWEGVSDAVADEVKVYCHDSVGRTEVHLSVFRLDVLWHTCASEVVIIVCQPDCVCVLEFAIRANLYFHNIWTLLCFSACYSVPKCSSLAFAAS